MPVDGALAQWTSVARGYRELANDKHDLEQKLKTIKTRMDEAEDVFVGLMGECLLAETGGVRVARYLQNGSVDYSALLKELAPNLDEATMNRFRREPSQRVKVTVQTETAVPTPSLASAETHFYF